LIEKLNRSASPLILTILPPVRRLAALTVSAIEQIIVLGAASWFSWAMCSDASSLVFRSVQMQMFSQNQ
jgi:hypothetical protein